MKRKNNTALFKVSFLPATNNRGSRIKVTQCNLNKSKIIEVDYRYEVLEQVLLSLDRAVEVESYSVCVDNTQNNYTFISVEFKDSLVDILKYF